MAELLGVSARIIERRFQDFGLYVRATYTDIIDAQLDKAVRGIISIFLNTAVTNGCLAICVFNLILRIRTYSTEPSSGCHATC